jgi:hypothetical protein
MNQASEKDIINERISLLDEALQQETELMEADPTDDFNERVKRKDKILSIQADREALINQLKTIGEQEA